jgi:hypothetical protein
MERFERVVLGSLSKVTRLRNWTAVDVTRMRERSMSMSRLHNGLALKPVLLRTLGPFVRGLLASVFSTPCELL